MYILLYSISSQFIQNHISIMTERENEGGLKDSFLNVPQERSGCFRVLKKLDVFSFVPFPKNQPVTTNQSLCGSLLFLVIILSYVIFDFVDFVQSNPPSIQTYYTKLDDKFYKFPKFAINFMEGQALNETYDYSDTFSFQLTQEQKKMSFKDDTPVPLELNAKDNLTWINNGTQQFYKRLFTPGDDMFGKGLLYSTSQTNYSKITIKTCDVNNKNNTCQSFQNISSLCAKGRIFLFVELEEDTSTLGDLTNYGTNRFKLFNIFLIPQMYKRFTVEFQVVRTHVFADYFSRFSDEETERLEVLSIIEQTSNTSINDYEKDRNYSLQLLGITFQLSGEIQNVRASYETIIDRVAKWGAFSNLVFTIFCIIFLAYNRKKFYERHPDWDRFKKKRTNDLEEQEGNLHIQ